MHRIAFMLVLLAALGPVEASARTWVVDQRSRAATDRGSGTESRPFRTIQRGADAAQPGDTVLVYGGTYRERVKPPRGGTGESRRITYRAKPGERVVITGLDVWSPQWQQEGSLSFATPADSMFTDRFYVDGGNPYKIPYWTREEYCLGQVVVDGREYAEQKSRADAAAAPERWWADQKTGTIYVNFGGSPQGRTVEIATRRGVFRPYLKGLGYITVEGFDLAYCGNNGGVPGVINQLHPLYQSGLIGTRQGHHWKILGNRIRNAKGLGLSLSLGTDMDDAYWWDPHGLVDGKPHVEVSYGKVSGGDNEDEPGNPQPASRPYKEIGYNLVAGNVFESCGMNAIAGIGSVGNTIYGNRFAHCCTLVSPRSAEDATIKMHMQFGTLIERNLFEDFVGDHRAVWMDNNNPATRLRRNVFVSHPGKTPTVFFEITSSLDPYLSTVDDNLFLGCAHGVVSAAADGVAFYNNLFLSCGDGFCMGSRRDQTGSDYGNERIHAWNNLFVGQERAFGFAFNEAVNHHTSDYNLVFRPADIAFCKYLLTDGGTGQGPGGRPNVVAYKQADITAAKAGGRYWKEGVNWGADNGPNGCEADLGAWRGTMGPDIDRHSEERSGGMGSFTNRTVTLNLGGEPRIPGAPLLKGAEIDFFGGVWRVPAKAGPFEDFTARSHTYTFWYDGRMPALPRLPAAPAHVVTCESPTAMRVRWINRAPDASFIHIERRVNGGPWSFWGYVTTTQDGLLDYDLPVDTNRYEYRVAARNAAGLSPFAYPAATKE